METYILILLGKGVKTKTTSNDYSYFSVFNVLICLVVVLMSLKCCLVFKAQDYCHGFYQGFSLILDQLQRLARRNHYENFTDSNNNEGTLADIENDTK